MKQAQSVKRALSKTKSKAKSKAKSVLQEVPNLFKQEPLQPIVVPITSTDVIRYRYHHGVNLGTYTSLYLSSHAVRTKTLG